MKSPYRYLRCSAQGEHSGCINNGKQIRIADFERDFFVNYLMKNPSALIGEADSAEMKELNKQISAKTTELNKIGERISKLVSMEMDNVDEIKTAISKLNKERDIIKTELDILSSKVSSYQDSPENFHHIIKLVTDIDIKKSVRYLLDKGLIAPTGKAWKYNQDFLKKIQRNDLVDKVNKALEDNYVREGLRILIPPLIGKIVVDVSKRQYFIYNRMDKLVYESPKYEAVTNETSIAFKEAMKKWTTRKMKDGRIVKVNRKSLDN